MVTRKVFWTSYAIVVFFQLVSNGMFTGFGIVKYDGDAIIGETSPAVGAPPFIGEGRHRLRAGGGPALRISLILPSIAGMDPAGPSRSPAHPALRAADLAARPGRCG
jgi:hypothetical protein